MVDQAHRNLWNVRLHRIALTTVGVGAVIGMVASFVAWGVHGEFATTTFVTSATALAAAGPVFRDYRRLVRSPF